MTVLASLIMFILVFVSKKQTIEKWAGALMILIYIGYLAFLISSKM